ncbi:MAG TPA: TRAM domain-containing protein [Patescibacteria group bacterium]|nr:TRAM domain-containing protein [Patescibacteria group bacterium]
METRDIVLLAVTLIILGEVSYLLAKLPKTSIKAKDRAILVDTSVLMDGRITSLAATGFIGGTLVVPRSVIGELQLLADQADADKRARARNGLDIVSTLQGMDGVEVEILQDGSRAAEGVDERLLTLAKQHSAVICTLDYNLNKVAVVEGIKVLNINELAQSLRMQHLPGEQMMIELSQKGQDNHQGVGYLSDGTMVVVEQSNKYIGQTVQVEVVRSLQTAAGKMMFARRVERQAPKKAETPAMVAAKTKSAGRSRRNDNESTKPKHVDTQSQQTQQPKQQKPQPQQTQKQQQSQPVQKPANQQKPRAVYHAARKRVNHEDSLLQLVDSQKDE